jgi:hypothetical protein
MRLQGNRRLNGAMPFQLLEDAVGFGQPASSNDLKALSIVMTENIFQAFSCKHLKFRFS